MNWYKNKYLKKCFLETTEWNVAWKMKHDDRYNIINNPTGYWLADSLIYESKQGVFLFVEAFEKEKQLGRLGFLRYNGQTFSDFNIILKEKYHLSYPYLFSYKDIYYMIPESSCNKTIDIYKCKGFPYTWEKIKTLAVGEYVDTSVIQKDAETFFFYTYDIKNHKAVKGFLDMNLLELNNLTELEDVMYERRAGGNLFVEGEKLYQPLQYNKYFYGQSLRVVDYETGEVKKIIIPENILTVNNSSYRRIHTYSNSGKFEAIDLSDYKFNMFKIIKKMRSR